MSIPEPPPTFVANNVRIEHHFGRVYCRVIDCDSPCKDVLTSVRTLIPLRSNHTPIIDRALMTRLIEEIRTAQGVDVVKIVVVDITQFPYIMAMPAKEQDLASVASRMFQSLTDRQGIVITATDSGEGHISVVTY